LELTFVDTIVTGRHRKYPWAEAISAIKKNPNRWALLPFEVHSASIAYIQAKKLANRGLEVVCADGNGLATGHPDKKLWKVYLRFTPPENN
jgi:hypothetical protein